MIDDRTRDRPPSPQVPNSACAGIVWPAVPTYKDRLMLALAHQLQHTQWWPPELLARMQMRQLRALSMHAAQTVPFYRDRLDAVVGGGEDDLTWQAWRRIPVLRRSDIQASGPALVSGAHPGDHGGISDVETSGSTGRPISVKRNSVSALYFRASSLRYHLWHRRDFSGRVAGLLALSGTHAEEKLAGRTLNWLPGYASGPMQQFDITRPFNEQFEWLIKQDPDYLLVAPSVLRAVLERCRDTGARLPRLRQVSTLNETLDAEVRDLCDEVWGVPLSDAYSAEEVGMIAYQCPDHPCYHVQAESLLVEVLDKDGRPCRQGAAGRVVLTDLHNFTMPLIRYEIGDYAEVGPPCACGRGLPVLARILGRSRNMLTLPSGDRIWPKLPELLNIPVLRQIQVIQRSLTEMELNLVVDRPLTEVEEGELRHDLTETFRQSFSYKISYVDQVPRSASGKFEGFKSALS